MIWHVIGEALKYFLYFMVLIIAPLFTIFAILATSIWGSHIDRFRDIASSMMSMLQILKGQQDFEELMHVDMPAAIVFLVIFYVIMHWFLMSVFTTLALDAYYRVNLSEGYDPA